MTTAATQSQDTSSWAQIEDILSRPTAKHSLTRQKVLDSVHFRRIIKPYTDLSLGDCSYLNTCHRIEEGCKYVHYELEPSGKEGLCLSDKVNVWNRATYPGSGISTSGKLLASMFPPQWINCDVRKFDLKCLGRKFPVIMADPPWDIHMSLPYGTMTDDEMKQMGLHEVQDEGLLFLWVTGRAMEVARDCLKYWGYRRVDEIVWIKTNQAQRIIRTGRTGHWMNHSKVLTENDYKMGNFTKYNPGLDGDVLVAEVRETSRKPDEIYCIIERLCPGVPKLEIFGRQHNTREGWLTLGNQLQGSCVHDPKIRASVSARYPWMVLSGPHGFVV
ncbi:MT-A70-domain-containing protein [Zopfochytrium polystomum]|nr:MT-A70-domain-containing protein [Zopfochytrium polystomum]